MGLSASGTQGQHLGSQHWTLQAFQTSSREATHHWDVAYLRSLIGSMWRFTGQNVPTSDRHQLIVPADRVCPRRCTSSATTIAQTRDDVVCPKAELCPAQNTHELVTKTLSLVLELQFDGVVYAGLELGFLVDTSAAGGSFVMGGRMISTRCQRCGPSPCERAAKTRHRPHASERSFRKKRRKQR